MIFKNRTSGHENQTSYLSLSWSEAYIGSHASKNETSGKVIKIAWEF